jgi:hypothetical protein
MKTLILSIVLFSMILSSSVYGQDKENELPNQFMGDWVETLSQCEISPLLSISMVDNQLVVSGYEWYSDEVKVKKNDKYYTLLLKGFSEGEEYESELNIKMGVYGNLIIVTEESEETSYIRCGEQDNEEEPFDIGLLQGKWKSVDDESNFLIFENNLRKEIYVGFTEWDEEIFVVSEKCLNEFNMEDNLIKEKNRYISCSQSDLCWYVHTLDSDTLILGYLGRGNLLTYVRVR